MSEWWRDFFNEEYINLYGKVDAENTESEIEGIVKMLDLSKGSKILDLCCGYGRHVIGLAKKGYDLTGYDLSDALLERARKECKAQKVNVALAKGDAREIPYESEFDAVINMFTSFGYFENEAEDQKVLNRVHAALKPAGKFLLDTINREWVIRAFQKKQWEELGKNLFALDERSFDPLTSRISARTVILGGGKRIDRHHSMRLYTLTELGGMIAKAGMRVRSVYGHVDGRDYWIDTRRMVILAYKE